MMCVERRVVGTYFRRCLAGVSFVVLAGEAPPVLAEPLQLKGSPGLEVVPPLVAADLPDILAQFQSATKALARTSSKVFDSYQKFIRRVDKERTAGHSLRGTTSCLTPELSDLLKAVSSGWNLYQRQARIVRNYHRRIELYYASGYGPGLTPDIQAQLLHSLEAYDKIRQEHIDLQSLLRQQLEPEIRRIGCDPAIELGIPSAGGAIAKSGEPPAKELAPSAGATVASPTTDATVLTPTMESTQSPLGVMVEDDESHHSGIDVPTSELALSIYSSDDLLPEDSAAQSILVPDWTTAWDDGPSSDGRIDDDDAASGLSPADAAALDNHSAPQAEPKAKLSTATPKLPDTTPSHSLRVHFVVDNRQCITPVQLFLDGSEFGLVAGEKKATFESNDGRHDLCLAREGKKKCANSSDYLRVYLYDGFAIKPGC